MEKVRGSMAVAGILPAGQPFIWRVVALWLLWKRWST